MYVSNMYKYFEKQIFKELETESLFFEKVILSQNIEQLSSINTKNRISIIHSDGTVFFDNAADISTLDNHANRQEFAQAKINGVAKHSLFIDYDRKLCILPNTVNGDVLRISCEQYSIWV